MTGHGTCFALIVVVTFPLLSLNDVDDVDVDDEVGDAG